MGSASMFSIGSKYIAAVRCIAATCLGDVARIHWKLDLDKAAPVLKGLLDDPEIYVRASAANAIEDIQILMHVVIQAKGKLPFQSQAA